MAIGVHFRWEVSLGAILQTASLLGALIGGFVQFHEDHRALRWEVNRAVAELGQVRAEYVRRDVMTERERVVAEHLAEIERRLGRIEFALR